MAVQTKNSIKQRLLKTASESWGVQPSELASFDPVVSLIYDACSTEMEKIYNELEVSQSRTFERLSKLLIPEVYKGPQPAHSILHASPTEPTLELTRVSQFYYNKKIILKESSVKESFRDIYFTPVDDYLLLGAEIKYIAYGDSIHKLNRLTYREKVASGVGGKQINRNELWIGLQVNKEVKDLSGLLFFLDWVNVSDLSLLLSYLPFTRWYTNSGELNYKPGYQKSESRNDQLEEEFEFDVEKSIFRDIKAYYQGHFITLSGLSLEQSPEQAKAVPGAFADIFGQKSTEKLEKVVWLKIVFPAFVVNPEFDNLNIAVNCFPVLNRGLHEMNYRIQNSFNIVPLNVQNNEYFFSILSVKNGEGKAFTNSSLKDLARAATGLYVVRKGGVQRFDSRNASEYLNNLENLLRDESAAFQVFGQEIISDNVRQLSQILNQILQRVEKSGNNKAEGVNYLVLKPDNFDDMIFVEFWSTTGAFANDIRLGNNLTPYSGSDVNGESLILMTTTTGGTDNLSGAELLETFRHTLLSRERVVTEADIRYFCLKELGEKISEVEIVKGLQLSSSSGSGFIKTIDICLVPSNAGKYTKEEWNFICGDLKAKLESKMSTFLPVNVRLKTLPEWKKI